MVFVLMFFLIFGLVVITAMLFGVWVLARVVIWIVGALLGIDRKPQTAAAQSAANWASPCARPNCRAVNPVHARFCHRCGNAIAVGGRGAASPAPMRYVA
jgi:hypothetical protein